MKKNSLYYNLLGVLLLVAFSSSQAMSQESEEQEGVEEAVDQGVAALVEFGEQEGVIKRPSGLLIKIVERGEGGIIKPTDRALVNYEGRLADGTVFDTSYGRGPAAIPVYGVIRGWEEALLLMQIGSKWEIALPSKIAYGKAGQRGIPPDSILFFTVELVGVI